MGTEISLDIGGLSIDWSKNSRGDDHGSLFQDSNVKRVRSNQINYEYFVEKGENPATMEMAFVRPLKDVVPRLELLGFTLESAKTEYLDVLAACNDERESLDSDATPELMSFDEFFSFATTNAIQSLDDTFVRSHNEKKIRGKRHDL